LHMHKGHAGHNATHTAVVLVHAQETCISNLLKFGRVIPDICMKTNRQTKQKRSSQYCTPILAVK